MTISYSFRVSNSSFLRFTSLLFRWKGSLYKYIWRELTLYLVGYYLISICYRFALTENQQKIFNRIANYSSKNYTDSVGGSALTFLLGFYLQRVGSRWWEMFCTIPWPDKLALLVPSIIAGKTDEDRLVRRTLMRYVNLMTLLGFRSVSSAVLKRFPTIQHVVDAGLMTDCEMEAYESYSDKYNKHYLPAQWATSLLMDAKTAGRIDNEYFMIRLIDEVDSLRQQVYSMLCYNWVSIPLMYTHVVTVAIYAFFGVCLISRQSLVTDKDASDIYDIYVPLFTILQFLFYVGLLKVAETNLNPFGVDDDDFEVNYIIERNLKVSYVLVDECFQAAPAVKRDVYWSEPDFFLPYTNASVHLKDAAAEDSAASITLTPEESATAEEPRDDHRSHCGTAVTGDPARKSRFRKISGQIVLGLRWVNRAETENRSSEALPKGTPLSCVVEIESDKQA